MVGCNVEEGKRPLAVVDAVVWRERGTKSATLSLPPLPGLSFVTKAKDKKFGSLEAADSLVFWRAVIKIAFRRRRFILQSITSELHEQE